MHSYEVFLSEYDKGNVYVSKKHTYKLLEFLENDDDAAIQRLIEKGEAKKYESNKFDVKLREDLLHDLEILREIQDLWKTVKRDPKLLKFKAELSSSPILKKTTSHYLH